MTYEFITAIWQTIGFLEGIEDKVPRAETYAECLKYGITHEESTMGEVKPTDSETITCADAPMTYTSDCSKCANNTCKSTTKPTANCMGFREVK